MTDALNKILTKISSGEYVSQYELLPFLVLKKKNQRLKINLMLALAYFQSDIKENIIQAAVFIKRAWSLSGFDEDLLPLYEKIHLSLNETGDIKEAYKRLFIKSVDSNNYDNARKYFDLWQNAYSIHQHLDKYEYDYDIIRAMTKLAEPFVLSEPTKKTDHDGDKKRLAYFVTGMSEVNSVLLKIDLLFAKYHNKEKYEIVFFTLNTEEEVVGSQQGKHYLDLLRNDKVEMFFADKLEGRLDKIISLAKKIYNYKPDLIIEDVALKNFDHYFLTLILTKLRILCFNAGPPPQFIPPHVNWSITWTKHPLIDTPVDCYLVPLEFELFDGNEIQEFQKSELNIPDDSFVIVCAGRTQKFQDLDFWNVVGKILTQNPNVYFLAVGIEESYAPDLSSMMDGEAKRRIKFFGWQKDYLRLLKSADLVFDTYPSGGGVVLIDSMVLGIPILFFNNDYMNQYDQNNWSPAEEILDVPELAVPRGDFEEFLHRANEIITNNELRLSLGQKCRENIISHKGNPLRMVQRHEEIYDSVIDSELTINNEEMDLTVGEIKDQLLVFGNFKDWQKAFEKGYNSNMGDHSNYFYNKYLKEIGLYSWIAKSSRIIEYGPGNALFMRKFIDQNPDKKFYLCEIAEKVVEELKTGFGKFDNVEILLNYPELENLEKIDLAFSFLLCQSMPKTIWMQHLSSVKKMLSNGGCYIFQFAYHPEGVADDNVVNAISGSNKYKPDEIFRMLEEAGFNGCDISEPIRLNTFNTDILWYFCRAY